jgi:DnaJ homolog subfamily C member 28
MNRQEKLVEKMIREAMEQGEFDNLPGKGQPLDLSENPFEDPDLRMVHRILRNAGFAPAWIEERKDIDAALDAALVKLRRAWRLFGKSTVQNTNPEWERTVSEFRELVDDLNVRIRLYNLKAPSAVFHRRLIDFDKAIADVQNENSMD